MKPQRDETVTEVPNRRGESSGQLIVPQIEVGERRGVAELKRDSPSERVDIEVKALERRKLPELLGKGAGKIGRRELKREKVERRVFGEREVGPVGRGEVSAEERSAIGEDPLKAPPLAERHRSVPGRQKEIIRVAPLKGRLDFVQQKLNIRRRRRRRRRINERDG